MVTKRGGQAADPELPGFPADPHKAAQVLYGLIADVARAQHTQTTTYCREFLAAGGAQEQRRAIAAQKSAGAQRDLDLARGVLEAWRLQADMTREVTP